jgi:hypothetical protein
MLAPYLAWGMYATALTAAVGDPGSSWKLWGGHLNRILKPFGFRLVMRTPSWRHGGGAR